jgi:hypothetical protein
MEELNCNIDATIFEKLRSYRIGMCIQNNERGEFVEANISPQEAEAIALYEVVLCLRELGV